MNSINLIGNLVRDPEIAQAKKGKERIDIAKFTVAVNRVGSEEADFIRCICFGKTAEFAEDYLSKGQRVGITGRIQTGSYEHEEKGTIYTTDIIVERITFADGKKDDGKRRRGKDDD